MRYTTLIDLREWPEVYRNINIRLVYMHLCLVAGYHDYNRDVTKISIRSLSADTGCSISAVRHAIAVLAKQKLIKRQNGWTYVRKWIPEQKTSPRPKTTSGKQIVEETPTEKKVNGWADIRKRAAEGDPRAIELCQKYDIKRK